MLLMYIMSILLLLKGNAMLAQCFDISIPVYSVILMKYVGICISAYS